MAVTPYVVGQWVRGDAFYGRRSLLRDILTGPRNGIWLLGTRRVGKTSALKELDRLARESPGSDYFPVFWDFQGVEGPHELRESFRDSLLDVSPDLEELGIDLEAVDRSDLFESINRLRRALGERDRRLLLLGDEAEELVAIHERAPQFLTRLRRVLQSSEGVRAVLASTIRLWRLAERDTSTSPFLHGFTPARVVGRLSDDAALSLVRQDQLAPEARPEIDGEAAERIRAACNNHPFLLQLVAERHLESGDLTAAIEEVEADSMAGFFFQSDLSMLESGERSGLRWLACREEPASEEELGRAIAPSSSASRSGVHRLELLGFVARDAAGGLEIANRYFRRWLLDSEDSPDTGAGRATSERVLVGDRTLVGGRYDLLEKLGDGSTGEVFKARDTLLDSIVAVKLLRRDYGGEKAALERLRREVLLARDLSHPNLLKVYHLGADGDRRYVTMRYIDGENLAKKLASEARPPLAWGLSVARKLASALAALHRCEVLHRDLKPSNVLIDRSGEPHISDFGLARLPWSPGVTRDGGFVGTPAYASPEQAMGGKPDARSDLYALGLVLFELFTGQRAFEAGSGQDLLELQVHAPVPRPSGIAPDIPEELSAIVLRCLEKKPLDRYESAEALEANLERVRLPAISDSQPATPDGRSSSPARS